MKHELRRLLPCLAAVALIGATACSVAGWAVTAYELNTLIAYQPVGVEALRALKANDDVAVRVRLARSRVRDRIRSGKDDPVFARRVAPAVYETHQ